RANKNTAFLSQNMGEMTASGREKNILDFLPESPNKLNFVYNVYIYKTFVVNSRGSKELEAYMNHTDLMLRFLPQRKENGYLYQIQWTNKTKKH
ncbi:hypothetical protein Bhyg_13372, partial [Pseudolycoriella hygida]